MQMSDRSYEAQIRDCNNCKEMFLNSTQMGQMTTKLWRSKTLSGKLSNFRVLTVSDKL